MSGQPVEAAVGTGLLGQLIGNLNVELSDRMKRMIATYVLTTASIEVVRRTHRRVRSRFVYTIAVPSGDEIYDVLHQRILALIPEARRRSLVIRAMRGTRALNSGNGLEIADSNGRTAPRLTPGLFYDSTREQAIEIGGRRVLVTVEKEEDSGRDGDRYYPRRDRIVFTAYGSASRDAVMTFIGEITEGLNDPNVPRFYMAQRWGGWDRRDDLEPRQLDTVILRPGQKEGLIADVERFLSMRPAYERLGIPWHRGYLFHGPPGTGKTSLAKALATHLGIDIYYVPISDLETYTSLLQLVAAVPAGSILLLEDIDILHSAKERDDVAHGVTMSGLLNALDGVSTPAGLITVMTTNHREVLDDAMLRAGRVDREEQIGYLDDPQLIELVSGFFGGRFPLPKLNGRKVTPAEVAEVLKRQMGERENQRADLLAFLKP